MIASSALIVTTHVSIEEARNGTSESDYTYTYSTQSDTCNMAPAGSDFALLGE
jgi:hypothetical protein